MAFKCVPIPSFEVQRTGNLANQAYLKPVSPNYIDSGLSAVVTLFPIKSGQTFVSIKNNHASTELTATFLVKSTPERYQKAADSVVKQFTPPYYSNHSVSIPGTKHKLFGGFGDEFKVDGEEYGAIVWSGPAL